MAAAFDDLPELGYAVGSMGLVQGLQLGIQLGLKSCFEFGELLGDGAFGLKRKDLDLRLRQGDDLCEGCPGCLGLFGRLIVLHVPRVLEGLLVQRERLLFCWRCLLFFCVLFYVVRWRVSWSLVRRSFLPHLILDLGARMNRWHLKYVYLIFRKVVAAFLPLLRGLQPLRFVLLRQLLLPVRALAGVFGRDLLPEHVEVSIYAFSILRSPRSLSACLWWLQQLAVV